MSIDNPTLTVADNLDVASGEPQSWTLVRADEFVAAWLDPEVWLFENRDGGQYGIRGWSNNELPWYLDDSAKLRDGMLVITVRRKSVSGKSFTSAHQHPRLVCVSLRAHRSQHPPARRPGCVTGLLDFVAS